MKKETMAEINEYMQNRQLQLGMDFGLTRMETLLTCLDNPHHHMKFIHIAGTNGKGSTLNYLKEILQAEGIRTGAFTSPYLESVNEQLAVNQSIISDREFISLFNQVHKAVKVMDRSGNGPTHFEILTAMAFLYFKQKEADIVLLETGLGGRLDSTNVVTPVLSIITSISLEHTDILGHSIDAIAREKAGIIKRGVPVISGAAEQAIQDKAAAENAKLYQLNKDFFIENLSSEGSMQKFSYRSGTYKLDEIELSMLGKHQAENASLAVTAILLINERQEYSIHEESIRHGLRHAVWGARLELVSKQQPFILLDGAHNPAGISALIETLQHSFPGKTYRFIFAALKDKNYQEMISTLDQKAHSIIFTEFPHERAAAAELLYECSKTENIRVTKDWQKAIDDSLGNATDNEVLIITGSLYFLSLVRPYLNKKY
ncbi:folylpolyglutamate synthase/dihydrofolate synthase family protein [Bacillus sp. V59.32b]|uniref:bifunctional folylpolyglutamate synthase/dihydrofolate synthase n=1 Tax=Bacillus sp. V59.32b TaxID=1758642 RepID=UPI000E3BB513|nr:folylpolyglutamate synthase/dihydrofolate synthase family protein [Bacillus sp. V59.32b]RFU62562.1 bifunctional folylpolyglutamate synthase/dihydrofolate synthase [Bacillus sp. V59.32b]